MRCILAGGTWPRARLHAAGLAESAACPRCGGESETALHRWWECPAWDEERRRAGVLDLARMAGEAGYSPRCLWQNGEAPASATAVPLSPFMVDQRDPPRGTLPGLGGEVVEAWTDGAAADPQARRLGLWIPGQGGGVVAIGEPVPGPVQTAQRVEVRAFVAAVEATAGAVKVWADSRFVCRGVGYLDLAVCPPFAHRDLWERALAIWRPGVSAVAWVK